MCFLTLPSHSCKTFCTIGADLLFDVLCFLLTDSNLHTIVENNKTQSN